MANCLCSDALDALEAGFEKPKVSEMGVREKRSGRNARFT